MSNRYAYWQGNIVPVESVHIHPQDLGVLRGYGVFDVMRTENGKPFLWERHWARFQRSAELLGLRIPVTSEEYVAILRELIEKNGFEQTSIRTVLTGGRSESSFLPEGNETFFILMTPFTPLDEKYFSEGAKLVTLDYSRQFPQAKVTQYVAAIRHANQRQKEGALEILFVKDGMALEASTSNFAIVQGKTIVAPKENILSGITRGLALELARKQGFEVEEREVSLEEVLNANEMFLTATNKYIVPVVRIDDRVIGSGWPGETTKKLMQAMQEFVTSYENS
jgi:branched-chain amino acid aminotransferase